MRPYRRSWQHKPTAHVTGAKVHSRVFFSRLYGMSDNISFNLANAGYNAAKYLPYGPAKAVLPYRIRRAQENSAIAGLGGREVRFIQCGLRRRKQARALSAGQPTA
nr:proline dehydrogenase family protein [Vitiosangium sp. GDMCC 1.1324]